MASFFLLVNIFVFNYYLGCYTDEQKSAVALGIPDGRKRRLLLQLPPPQTLRNTRAPPCGGSPCKGTAVVPGKKRPRLYQQMMNTDALKYDYFSGHYESVSN